MDTAHLGLPEPEPQTRPPLPMWDRVKLILLFVGVWAVLAWNWYVETQVVGATLADAVRDQARSNWMWLALAGVETLRQLHYIVSEHWAAWHRFWSQSVFGRVNRATGHMNDWTRFRLARLLKVVGLLIVLAFVLGRIYDVPATTALFELPQTIWNVLPLIFQLLFAVVFIVIQFVALFWFLSRGGVETYMPNDVKTRFSDVWGQDNVVDRVKENLVFLDDPESIEEKGGYLPQGILLWGPPGTGKTLMAEAVAGETGKPFVFVEPGAFQNMFMGVGILKVKALFRKLRKLSVRYGGVVAFFDEADALGSRALNTGPGPFPRGAFSPSTTDRCNGLSYVDPTTAGLVWREGLTANGELRGPQSNRMMFGMGGGGSGTLQALLAEMSGLKKPRGFLNRYVRRALGMRPKPPPKYRMLLMMATNLPEALDEAMLRPGRIDRIYKVGYPSKAGRIRTYQGYLAKVQHELTDDEVDKLATITPYATGATIKDMVNEALINAIREDRETITWKDIIKAKQLKDLGLPEDVEYIERERHAVAIHEACHAVAAYRVRRHLTIDIATIEKGGTYLGMVASIPPEDQFTRWKSEYEADIVVSVASLVGERLFFGGDSSSGVSGDLNTATLIASYMEGFWGMGSTIASHGITHELGVGGGGGGGGDKPGKRTTGKDAEELLRSQLGQRIEKLLADIVKRTQKLLEEHRHDVLAVAHALETHKTLTGEDVEAIIEGREGPLIDGRVYRQPEFVELAEEYHRHALDAHRAHSQVKVGLPTLETAYHSNGHANGSSARTRRRRTTDKS